MQVLQEDDFKKMAQDIVTAYLEKDVPLADGLAKTAEGMGLNPDQIQNLVQLANSLAHLTLFENKQGGDKVIDFSAADPEDVLKKVYKEGPVPEQQETCEMASPENSETDFFGDFPDLSKIREAINPGEAPGEVSSEPGDGASPQQHTMMIIKIRKVASELKNRELTSAIEYREELDKLATEFAKLYGPDFAEFEKKALAFRGNLAVPVLTDIRSCLRIPGEVEETTSEKIAFVVDTKAKEMLSLDKLIKLAEDHRDYAKAYKHLHQKAGSVL